METFLKMPKDRYEASHDKRNVKLIVGVVVTVTVVLGALLWVTRPPSEETPARVQSSVPLSKTDQLASESVAAEFLKVAGNFGIKSSEITGDNIRNVSYLLTTGDVSINRYLTSREDSYSFLNRSYIYTGSPLDYDSRAVAQWKAPTEDRNLTSYQSLNVVAKARTEAQMITLEGIETPAAEVDVTFDSKETIRLVTANDTTWDGSYSVLEKSFPKNTVTLLLVQDETVWKVYSQSNLQKQFLLSTWANPDSTAYSTDQTGFTQVSTLKLTEPLKESK
jgi:hypothetical protein